ncbi:MAG: HlyD family efflux transporter periplasmic adaptor subunit [Dokdonella sp.]
MKIFSTLPDRCAAIMLIALTAIAGCHKDQPVPATSANSAESTSYVAMARGQVDVEGGLIRISAAHDGIVSKVDVADGGVVKAGQVLAELDARKARASVDAANAELSQAKAQGDVLTARRAATDVHARRVAEAASAGAATGQAADEAHTAASVLKAEIASAAANVAVAEQHLAQARAEIDLLSIRAPVAGRIVNRAIQVGAVVNTQTGATLFELLPDRPRIVRAELNEAFVDQVKIGMLADVVRDSAPTEIHTAKVIRIGDVFGDSKLADDPLERATSRELECVLQLEGTDLRVGQRVLVKFRRADGT